MPEVHELEAADIAASFTQNVLVANGGVAPQYLHSDNGAPMTGKTMKEFLHDCQI